VKLETWKQNGTRKIRYRLNMTAREAAAWMLFQAALWAGGAALVMWAIQPAG